MQNANALQLIAATYTPMDSDGKVLVEPIRPYCDALVNESAVSGVFVCGTTGEGLSLTMEERQQVAETWVQYATNRLKVIVHVGHTSIEDSCRLAAHGASIGADGVATLGPIFFKPATLDELLQYCEIIAKAAPTTPFYYYHIPSMTGLHFPMAQFARAAIKAIPNFAGIKFTNDDLVDFQQCLHVCEDRHTVLFGRDEMLLAAMAMGGSAAIGSTYSFMASLYASMAQAVSVGDWETARARQLDAQELIDIMLPYGGVPAGKALLQVLGFPFGPPRQPLVPLPQDEAQTLSARIMNTPASEYLLRTGD